MSSTPKSGPCAIAWSIAAVDVETIDRINIRQASLLAMRLAVEQLALSPDYLLIDGIDTIDWPCPQQPVVQGDGTSLSIAAASVLAKVHRDRLLVELDAVFPGLRAGAAQGLLLAGAPGGAGAAGAYAAAPQELCAGGADGAGVRLKQRVSVADACQCSGVSGICLLPSQDALAAMRDAAFRRWSQASTGRASSSTARSSSCRVGVSTPLHLPPVVDDAGNRGQHRRACAGGSSFCRPSCESTSWWRLAASGSSSSHAAMPAVM